MRNPVRGIDRRSPLAKRRGAPAAPLRTLYGISVSAYSGDTYTFTITGDAVDGELTKVRVYSGSDPTTKEQVDAGVWPGGTVVDPFSYSWAALPPDVNAANGIPRANYKFAAVVANGTISNFVLSNAVEIDTLDAALSGISFSNDSAGGISYSFQGDEASPTNGVRVSAWPAGTNPDEAAIKAGTGNTATALRTGAAGTPITGTLATGAGTFQVGIYYSDTIYGNETFYLMPGTVTVTAGATLATDPGRIYRYRIGTATRSGTDVTSLPDGGLNPVDLTTTPAAFDQPTQANAASPIVLNAAGSPGPTIIQTPSSAAGNRKMMEHLRGGGSLSLMAVVDTGTLGTAFQALFSESLNETDAQCIQFGCHRTGAGNADLRFLVRMQNNGGEAFSSFFTATGAVGGLKIVELQVTQTTYTLLINGVSVSSGGVTAANFPGGTAPATCRTTVGAVASTTASTRPATGNLFEIFCTGNMASLGVLRAELAALYGITL